ncbi:MAG: PD-(D/E)XK nuclease family protein [Deltaproteobacteria bacterium]|nr:PD-(D/E)XK nuclease family protein [Deltaproteobacteria bacterium]
MAEPDSLRWRLKGVVAERLTRLNYAQRRKLAALSCTPDLMAPLGLQSSEIHHTRMLRWLLDPADHPALGRAPLEAFLLALRSKSRGTGKGSLIDALGREQPRSVIAEKVLPDGRRVDLAIEYPNGWLLVENKIDSTEHDQQLSAYQHFLDTSGKNQCILVYLTKAGEPKPDVDGCVHLEWAELLNHMLPVAIGGESAEHRYMVQYLASVARHVVEIAGAGPFDSWSIGKQHEVLDLIEGRP